MNIDLPEEEVGSSSGGCGDTGVGTPLAMLLAIGLILRTRKTRATSGRPYSR